MTTRPKRSTRPIAAGVIFVLVIVAVGLAAAGRPNNLLIWVFSFLMGGLLVSGIVSGLMMMPVRAMRIEPRRGRVGEPLLIRYEISNGSRILPVFDIRVDEALATDARGAPLEPAGHGWILHVGPRERFHAEGVFRPMRRGLARLEAFDVSTSFPFGLMRKSLRFTQSGDVLIHPEVKPLRAELIANVTAGGFGGQRLSRESGGFDDFFGVREYRPGDSVRTIAWKRLAGTGRLATIERSRAVPPRVRVLLDLRAPTSEIRVAAGEDARALEEQAIVLAASMVALCDRLGYEYAISLAGVEIPPIALRKGHFHREKIMSALAAIDLDLARTKGNGLAASDERAVILAIHPDRADLGIAPADAWHFTARQLDGLLERTAGEGA